MQSESRFEMGSVAPLRRFVQLPEHFTAAQRRSAGAYLMFGGFFRNVPQSHHRIAHVFVNRPVFVLNRGRVTACRYNPSTSATRSGETCSEYGVKPLISEKRIVSSADLPPRTGSSPSR